MRKLNDLVWYYTEDSMDIVYRVASEAIRKKRFGFAINILEEKIKSVDENTEDGRKWKKRLSWSLGDALIHAGKYEEAKTWFLKSDSRYYVAKCWVCLGNYIEAFDSFCSYAKDKGLIQGLPHHYALLSYLQGHYQDSLKYFEQELNIHPNRKLSKLDIDVLSYVYEQHNSFPPILISALLASFETKEEIINHKVSLKPDEIRNQILKTFGCCPPDSLSDVTKYSNEEIEKALTQKNFVQDILSDDPLIDVLIEYKERFKKYDPLIKEEKLLFIDSVESKLKARKKLKGLSDSYIYFVYLFETEKFELALELFYGSENIQRSMALEDFLVLKNKMNQRVTGKDIFLIYYKKLVRSPYAFTKDYQEQVSKLLQRNVEVYENAAGVELLRVLSNRSLHPDTYSSLEQVCQGIENEARQLLGLPRVGEGWVSETQTFNIVKKVFEGYDVVREASPVWLSPQRYDIFIPELQLAIEYQGEQHFRPIEHFGGEEGFKSAKRRDERKEKISLLHRVQVEYIKFDENIDGRIRDLYEEYVLKKKNNSKNGNNIHKFEITTE
ncbi:MAG: hypothetical protein ABSF91_10160 [Bacteroidota bacterium]|jgi:tetratricopeptide (TPR) repeat protein